MNGMHPRFSPCSVGVANLATRSFRDNGGRCMESAAATSPWLPPGGSCHDEISASRNRYFVVTDEGWRWLKVSDFHVGWRKPGHIPSIQLHSLTNLSPPLISLATLSSFPPGEAKGSLRKLAPFNVPICSGNSGWLGIHIIYKMFAHVIFLEFLECPGASGTPPGRNCNYCSSSSLSMMSVLISILGRWKGPLKVEPLVEGMVGRPSRRR